MGISEGFVELWCDANGCETVDRYSMTTLAGGGYDTRNLKRQAMRDGWLFRGTETICGDCVANEDEQPASAERADTER